MGLDIDMVELLLNAGADTNVCMNNGPSLLHIAAGNKDSVKMTQVLVNAGANIDTMTPPGDVLYTPSAGETLGLCDHAHFSCLDGTGHGTTLQA